MCYRIYAISLITALMFSMLGMQAQEERKRSKQQPRQVAPQQQQSPDVSDEELEQFAEISRKVQHKSQEMQSNMEEAVEEEGLTVDRYQEIMQAKQQARGGDTEAEADFEDEELQQFDRAVQRIRGINQSAQQETMQLIEESGMDVQRFQEIQMAVRQDPDLQKRMQEAGN